jgi:membrane protease YdiL (CAAX protease family)
MRSALLYGTYLAAKGAVHFYKTPLPSKVTLKGQSIFAALNNEELEKERTAYQNSTLLQRVKVGVIAGMKSVALGIIISILLPKDKPSAMSEQYREHINNSSILLLAFIGPLLEELMCRGVIQQVIGKMQSVIDPYVPHSFKWLTSPSARIVAANTYFAYAHISNTGSFGAQCQGHFLRPTCSILYETTGGLVAPITAHMTNNLITVLLGKLGSR